MRKPKYGSEVLEFKSQLLTSDIINLIHTLKLPIVEEGMEVPKAPRDIPYGKRQ